MSDAWTDLLRTLAVALGCGLAVIVVVAVAVRLAARRSSGAAHLAHAARIPFRSLVTVVALWVAVRAAAPSAQGAWGALDLGLRIATIVTGAWLVATIVLFVEDLGLRHYRVDVPDNRAARRARTQVLVIRRLTLAAIVVVAAGAVLLSFPGVQAVGASVLASAGIISVIAAVAAQSTLGNLIAGLQIAFSDSIRYDDAVIVEDEWGWIEEITLSYVVVRLWDDRRLVLPSTYFTTTPFQNWTRRHSELLGSVEFDLDWGVDTARMRDELDRVLAATDLWDGRAKVLQVTDAVGGYVRVRILATAVDAPTLFDLRCLLRERMVEWLQRENPGALPRHRVQSVGTSPVVARTEAEHSGLFSGDEQGERRAARATGQLPEEADEDESAVRDERS